MALNQIVVRMNWPLAAVLISLMLIVSSSVLVLVVTGHLSDQALWALGAWIAGMVKGALLPVARYSPKNPVPGITFKINGDSPPPPPLVE